jgi:hypothetical protein
MPVVPVMIIRRDVMEMAVVIASSSPIIM